MKQKQNIVLISTWHTYVEESETLYQNLFDDIDVAFTC